MYFPSWFVACCLVWNDVRQTNSFLRCTASYCAAMAESDSFKGCFDHCVVHCPAGDVYIAERGLVSLAKKAVALSAKIDSLDQFLNASTLINLFLSAKDHFPCATVKVLCSGQHQVPVAPHQNYKSVSSALALKGQYPNLPQPVSKLNRSFQPNEPLRV